MTAINGDTHVVQYDEFWHTKQLGNTVVQFIHEFALYSKYPSLQVVHVFWSEHELQLEITVEQRSHVASDVT